MSKFLEDKIVILKPNPRGGGMIKDKNHIGYFRYNGTNESFMLPEDNHNGGLVEIFESDAERKFFAGQLGVEEHELNVRRHDNYFYGFKVTILKDDTLMQKGKQFNLNDPIDNLNYRILLKSNRVAPTEDDRYRKGSYQYYFVEKGHKDKKDLTKINLESQVWAKYIKMQDSSESMYEFLYLYWLKTRKSAIPPKNPSLDYCKGQIAKIIESDKKGFLGVFESKSIKDEMLVYKGLESGLIDYDGSKFLNLEKVEIGRKLEDVIYFYNNPLHSKDKLKLQAQLKEENKKSK